MSIGENTFASAMGAASWSVKGASWLMSAMFRNRNSSARYVLVYDAATVPSDGAGSTPILSILLPAGPSMVTMGTDFFSPGGLPFLHGLVLVVSTAESGTQTTATAADHDIAVFYR
jgi:hypothetical protein